MDELQSTPRPDALLGDTSLVSPPDVRDITAPTATAKAMPISAPPAMTPAQTGSRFSTKVRYAIDSFRLADLGRRQKKNEPRNIAKQVEKGMTKARPMPTADSGKPPLGHDFGQFHDDAEHPADDGRQECRRGEFTQAAGQNLRDGLPDDGRRHGKIVADQSVRIVLQEGQVEDRHADQAPAKMPRTWPMAWWRGLPPSM